MIVDFHTHSTFSDGIYSPREVITKAYEAGCELFALTDHDTVNGLPEASQAATELGVHLVHAAEISALYEDITIHIVALNIDISNTLLTEGLAHHQALRRVRAENIAQFLESKGVTHVRTKVKEYAKEDMITRTHFARMLIDQKICANMSEVFNTYLGNNVASTKIQWASMTEVIDWIHAAGGLAILAHPLRYKISKAALRVLVRSFAEAGGDALETITARSQDNQINQVMSLGHAHKLLFSKGSDFHGDNTYAHIGKLKRIVHPQNIEHHLSL